MQESSRVRTSLRAVRRLGAALAILGAVPLLAQNGGGTGSGSGTSGAGSEPPVSVNTSANQVGRLTAEGTGQMRRYFQYDALGRITRTEHRFDNLAYVIGTAYGYPQNAAATTGPGAVPVSMTYPDGEVVTYGYDAGGQPQTIVSTPAGGAAQTILEGMQSNARGQVTSVFYGNGMVSTRGYNDASDLRLNQILTAGPGATGAVQDYLYTYDADGNPTAIADQVSPAFSATYTYDSFDQLTSMTSGGVTYGYQYDSTGNLIAKEGVSQSYGGSGRGPHALAAASGVAYGYDADGNMVSSSAGLAILWSATGMPVQRTLAGALINQKFYFGEEMWKRIGGAGVTTYYLPNLRVEGGLLRKFYGELAERSTDGSLEFYHLDHLGSSTVTTNQQQQVTHRIAYMPYGADRGAAAGTFTPEYQWNFKEKEGDGLYNFGARLYNPATGRWLSADSDRADGLNPYTFVRNNPMRFVDPTGHQTDYPVGLPENQRKEYDAERKAWLQKLGEYWKKREEMADPDTPQVLAPPVPPDIRQYHLLWQYFTAPILHPLEPNRKEMRPRRVAEEERVTYSKLDLEFVGIIRTSDGKWYLRLMLPLVDAVNLESHSGPSFSRKPHGTVVASPDGEQKSGFFFDFDLDMGLGGLHTTLSLSFDGDLGLSLDPMQTSSPIAGGAVGVQFLIYDPNKKKKQQDYEYHGGCHSADCGPSFTHQQ